MKPPMVDSYSLNTHARGPVSAAPGGDLMTSAHMRNWLDCVRSRKTPNADIVAGYNHSVADVMTMAALRTGERVTFDSKTQEVIAGGEAFQ